MTRNLIRALSALLLWLALALPGAAQGWQRHSLGEYNFAVPADWIETARRADEIDFDSPDGRYTLWARLWFPDEPLLGYDDIVAHGELTVAGRNVLFVHSEFPGERFIQYAFDATDDRGRQFLFQLIGRDAPLEQHQTLFQRLAGKLVVAGVPALADAASPAPAPPAQIPAAVAAAAAGHAELLGLTQARYGSDCAPVDLAGWRHDTQPVMRKAGVTLHALVLCRGKSWPVFAVDLPADPRLGGNDGVLLPFYDAMFRANGDWDFTLVDRGFGAIVDVTGRGRASLTVDVSDLTN